MADPRLLSPHFSLQMLTTSQEAVRHEIDNTPTPEIVTALLALSNNILEPIYNVFGPIQINSAYRSLEVNRLVLGAPTSQHCRGEAADIVVPGLSVYAFSIWVRDSALPFDQLIWEFDAWTHISFTSAQTARHSVLTARHAVPVYIEGIA